MVRNAVRQLRPSELSPSLETYKVKPWRVSGLGGRALSEAAPHSGSTAVASMRMAQSFTGGFVVMGGVYRPAAGLGIRILQAASLRGIGNGVSHGRRY